MADTIKFVLDRAEKLCGKRRKCWLSAFSPFPSIYSKGSFLRVLKTWDYVVQG